MKAVFENEVYLYYTMMTGYAFAAVMLLFTGIFCFVVNLTSLFVNYEYVLTNMAFILVILIPLLTMRSIAEDKRLRTDQLLYSLPLKMGQIVLGKYCAALFVILMPMVIICFYPVILGRYGQMPYGVIYGTAFAFFMLAACLTALGLFISSLTESMVIAAGLGFTAMLLLYYMNDLAAGIPTTAVSSLAAFVIIILILGLIMRLLTKSNLTAILFTVALLAATGGAYFLWQNHFVGLLAKVIKAVSPFERFYRFAQGQFDLANVVYFLSVIFILLFMTEQSLENRRWNG